MFYIIQFIHNQFLGPFSYVIKKFDRINFQVYTYEVNQSSMKWYISKKGNFNLEKKIVFPTFRLYRHLEKVSNSSLDKV